MGIKHLRKIEDLFSADKKKLSTKTSIRDSLQIELSTVEDALSYLLSRKRISKIPGKIVRYKYRIGR